jgi:WXG100 family type VII secretion target
MGLSITEGQLQQHGQTVHGMADELNGHLTNFNATVAEMPTYLRGSTNNAYQSVTSQTLTPQMTRFIAALHDYASAAQTAGGKVDVANQENAARINGLGGSGAVSPLAVGGSTSALGF